MTCFWNGILKSLGNDEYIVLGIENKKNITSLIQELKQRNIKIQNTLWQNSFLTEKEQEEHYEAIRDYDITKIYSGHWTSTCDSFLLLLCELLQITIKHKFLNTTIIYKNNKQTNKILYFKSNQGHFDISSVF